MKLILKLTLIYLAGVYLFVYLLPQPHFFPFSFEEEVVTAEAPQAFWHLANYDGAHYQNISWMGYIAPFQTAFFPLYPILIRGVGQVINNHLQSAILISGFSLLATALVWQKLNFSLKSWLLLLSYPLAFFLLAGYTESLFLFLSLLTFYLYRENRFFAAGTAGLLASLSRFYGVLLLPLFAVSFWWGKKFKLKPLLRFLPLLLIPAGLGLYMIYLYVAFGDPLRFVHALEMWQKSNTTFPLQTVWRYLKIFATVSPRLWVFWVALVEFAALIIGSLGLYLLVKTKRWGESTYVALALLIPLLTGTLQSLPRYLVVLFPLFIVFSEKLPRKIFPLAVALGFLLQAIFMAAFLRGSFIS